ncbi:MAG: hypothetical protein KDA96_20080 [Planctomycetaceae bacterium]|nr:hypothetical protein [Planctomycetaceae bacterium]MCA9065383.1 hypothetical protein [Planctomycetaceae bacterium]
MKNEQPQQSPPTWLRWFANDCSRGFAGGCALAPVGCHFYFDDEAERWEVTLFISRTEVVGGPMDGRTLPAGVIVDIQRVTSSFDSVSEVCWQAERLADTDDLGNHVSVTGIARGHQVWLRILANAPDDVGCGRMLYASIGVYEDLW